MQEALAAVRADAAIVTEPIAAVGPVLTRLAETVAAVEAEVTALIGDADASQRTLLVREPFAIDPEAEIVSLVRSAAGGAEVTGASYWADAAFIAAAGIPTVMYGPGGEGAHAATEWVSVSDTERGRADAGRRRCEAVRMRALVNPAYAPAAVPAPSDDARPSTRLDGLPRRRRCATSATASGSRTSPTGSGCRRSRCSARRGRSSGRCARTRRSTRWSPPAPATTAGPSRTSRRCAGCAAASSCPARAVAGAARGDRGRGRGGRDRRRDLRGGGRAGRRGGRAAGLLRARRRRRLRSGALGHRRLRDAVRRARRARFDVAAGARGRRLARRRGGALGRRGRRPGDRRSSPTSRRA